MASNAEILKEYGKARQEQKKAVRLMHPEPIYCQASGCTNTKATKKGKYCVVCKVERITTDTNRLMGAESLKYHYGK